MNEALDIAAAHLGNTRAIARRSYVHPGVLVSFLEGRLADTWAQRAGRGRASRGKTGLTPEERASSRSPKRRRAPMLAVLDEMATG